MSLLNTIVFCPVNTFVFGNQQKKQDNLYMELKWRIKQARDYAKLSVEELAETAGCSIDLIRKLEQGNRKATTHIVKIARACKVNVDWLDSGEGDMLQTHSLYQTTSPEAKVLELMQQMDEATKYQAVKIIDTLAEPKKLEGTNSGQ